MSKTELIHPNWSKRPEVITDGFSIEMTAKDIASLDKAAPLIPAETPVSVTFLPGEDLQSRIAAIKAVRNYGFEPMPHFSARRLQSKQEFEDYLNAAVNDAGVRRCFVIAGDPPAPEGPFFDTSALLAEGYFERAGVRAIGVGGHPEGHPNMTEEQCWDVLQQKCIDIENRGIAPLIVTQFVFDAQVILNWLQELRARGVQAPVRIGTPGPAGIKTLMRFAARCGVSASTSVMKKYGVSLTKLMGTAGPDKLVTDPAHGLGPKHGMVRLHFYPFGGMEKTMQWITNYHFKASSK